MSTRRPLDLVIFADHPSLHRGFATVARAVAGDLHRRGWPLDYVGYYPPAPGWTSPGYSVTTLEPVEVPRSARAAAVAAELGRRLAASGERGLLLLCFGTLFDLQAVVAAAAGARDRVRIVAYVSMDFAPMPVQAMDVLGACDRVVPYTAFGHAAIDECAARAGARCELASPIPHGVDSACFRPLDAGERRRVRRALFDVGDDDLLVAYFGRNSDNKRADTVLRLFHLARSGRYVRCARCGATSASGLDRDGVPTEPPSECNACGSTALTRGDPLPRLFLYLHTDLDAHLNGPYTGGRDLLAIAGRYGVREHIRLRPDLAIGRGDDAAELAARMAACDVHVLPFECAGWELTVLETGACGVANVITDYAGPAEYARPFSRVVSAGSHVLDGSAVALIDTDQALRALLDLLGDPQARATLGEAGVASAARHDWHAVCARWAALLEDCVERWSGGSAR